MKPTAISMDLILLQFGPSKAVEYSFFSSPMGNIK